MHISQFQQTCTSTFVNTLTTRFDIMLKLYDIRFQKNKHTVKNMICYLKLLYERKCYINIKQEIKVHEVLNLNTLFIGRY